MWNVICHSFTLKNSEYLHVVIAANACQSVSATAKPPSGQTPLIWSCQPCSCLTCNSVYTPLPHKGLATALLLCSYPSAIVRTVRQTSITNCLHLQDRLSDGWTDTQGTAESGTSTLPPLRRNSQRLGGATGGRKWHVLSLQSSQRGGRNGIRWAWGVSWLQKGKGSEQPGLVLAFSIIDMGRVSLQRGSLVVTAELFWWG